MLILAVIGLGISGGCFGTLTTVVLPRFFGRAHLGAISGVQMMLTDIASAIGPLPSLLANFKAITGSYSDRHLRLLPIRARCHCPDAVCPVAC